MTNTTGQDPSELEQVLASYGAQLRLLSGTLETAIARLEAGDAGPENDIGKTVGRLRDWLKAALDLEARIHDANGRQSGREASYALDLERARTELLGRLDRLWRTGED